MTVISLAHTNIVRSQSSVSRMALGAKIKTKKFLAIFLIFSIITCGFLYVMQSNSGTAQGYKINSLKKQLSELEKTNEQYQITISNMKSINFLETKAEGLNMVQVQTKGIDYLAFPTTTVVAAK